MTWKFMKQNLRYKDRIGLLDIHTYYDGDIGAVVTGSLAREAFIRDVVKKQ